MAYNRKDAYYHKAKKEGYKSRAAYKLMELAQKQGLIKKVHKVLDLGAAPGGWSQVALQLIGKGGKVVAVDYAEITGINDPNFIFIQGDMTEPETLASLLAHAEGRFDIVLSDMAPKTSGVKLKDHVDCMDLARLAMTVANDTLKPGGTFIVKIFDGEERDEYVKKMLQPRFTKVRTLRPDATRKTSYEMNVVATGF